MSTTSNSSLNRKRDHAEAFGITPPRGRVWLHEHPELAPHLVVRRVCSGGWIEEEPEEETNLDNLPPPNSPSREVIAISSDDSNEDSDETIGS